MASWPINRARAGSQAEPPRLVRRFALYAGIALIAASATAFFFVRRYATDHAEQGARAHTEYIAAAILPDRLRHSDFGAPARGRRLAELDRLARDELLVSGGLRVKLYDPRGVVVYSSDHSLIGTRPDDFAEIPAAACTAANTAFCEADGTRFPPEKAAPSTDGSLASTSPVETRSSLTVWAVLLSKARLNCLSGLAGVSE